MSAEENNILNMNSSKDSFIELLEYILNVLTIHTLHSSSQAPVKKTGPTSVALEHRFDIVLSGGKHMTYPTGKSIADIMMRRGEVHYCPPYNWKWPMWDSFHEMSSILYGPDYIRLTYINYDQYTDYFESHGAHIFYITSAPIGSAGQNILAALKKITEDEFCTTAHHLFLPLLEMTLNKLKNDVPRTNFQSHDTWWKIMNYVNNNFYYPINRAHVAAEFGLTPSYVSRLFAQEASQGFTATLRQLRMEYAAKLLTESDLSIDEITERCGYLSKTFFTSAFKKHHGVSPGMLRRKR